MSYQSNSELLLQRTGFYCDTLYELQQFIKNIKDRSTGKWITSEDKEIMHKLLTLLRFAELDVTFRYQNVLKERADDLQRILEGRHD